MDAVQPAVRLLTVVLFGAAACASAAPTAGHDLDTSAYPPCVAHPSPPPLPAVPGLVLPAEAIPFSAYEVGPLTQVEGVVSLTPVQAREFYEQHADVEVLSAEDELVEAELLVTDGTHRMFVKVQVACAGGSNFTATVGDEGDSDRVPTPAGQRGSGS